MAGEIELCSGLMWTAGASIPWTCRADTHVYNVAVGPLGWMPAERPGLRWLAFRSGQDPAHLIHIKVHADILDPVILELEIDGRIYADLEQIEGL